MLELQDFTLPISIEDDRNHTGGSDQMEILSRGLHESQQQ